MDTGQVMQDMNDKVTSMNNKYGKLMSTLNNWKKELEDIPNKFADRSAQFQENEKQKLLVKIRNLDSKIETWKNDQQEKIDTWIKDKLDSIQKQLEKKEKDLSNHLEKFKEKNNNEQ